jgi:MFS family permease
VIILLRLNEIRFSKDFWILFFINLANWTIAPVLAVVAKDITTQFPDIMNEGQVAFIDAIFLLISGISAILWGLIVSISKQKRKLLIIVTLNFACVGMFLTAFATNYWQLLIFQILTGIGYGAVIPLSYSMLMDFVPYTGRAKAFGIFQLTVILGMGLSSLISVLIIDLFKWWNITFIVPAIILFIGSIISIFLKEPKIGVKEKAYEGLSEDQIAEISFSIGWTELKKITRSKTTIFVIIFSFVINLTINSINFALPTYVRDDLGLTATISFLFTLVALVQIIANPYWGNRADKKFQKDPKIRIKLLILLTLIGNALFVLSYFVLDLVSLDLNIILWIVLFIIIALLANYFAGPLGPFVNTILGEVNAPEIRTAIYSLLQLINVIAASTGSFFMGIFYNLFGTFFWGIIIMYIFNICSVLLLIIPFKRVKHELDELNSQLEKRVKSSQT